MKSIAFLLVLILNPSAFALTCEVIAVTQEETFEKEFRAPFASQGHDVPEVEVKGKAHTVTAMADGKWLGISWRKSGELVAESLNLIQQISTQPRVLFIYNPKNTEEQVSINCQKI